MLEKFGLPAKPSIRGGSWVVDASHCQGCSSQFTFINRKHHCRRCGGLFCNSCTQQRMILRGQGDSPVRICDPCKKLEDAARFELRHGHKNRATKGNSKEISKNEEVHSTKNNEEEVLNQILGTNGKKPKLSENGLDMVSDLPEITTIMSGSYVHEESSMSASAARNGVLNASGSYSPEELRQQAMEEKKKYKILKGEGKPEEALQAFKRGKELERQAQALEITLRKNRRMASKASSYSGVTDTKETDDSEELSNKKKFPARRGSDDKDDLASELKGLGWSDADLHDAAKKPANLSLEGELANLIGEFPRKSSQGSGTGGIDKAQVIAHKKQALLFKREGKLAEAKEELKKAKVLEKQIEEQELLGEAEESDDELSALIRSMDDDKQDDLLLDRAYNPGINLDHLLGAPDDFALDGNFEVTDDDLNDPDLASALKSFGWTEEDDEHEDDPVMQSVPLDFEALKGQVLTLKREALTQKRAGNVSEAMALLKKAKLLEKDLEGMQSDTQSSVSKSTKTSESQSNEKLSVTRIDDETSYSKIPAKNKLGIQRELLGIKKKALSLRREGKIEEAEEELKKGKVLEQQLEELENAPKRPVAASVAKRRMETGHKIDDESGTLDLGEDKVDSDVTDQDMNDPALLSVLKNLGWQDEAVSVTASSEISEQISSQVTSDNGSLLIRPKTLKSKSEIQRELLSIKRKSLALRRQGKTEEAEEELKRAKTLEDQLADIEASNTSSVLVESLDFRSLVPQKKSDSSPTVNLLKSDEDAPSSMNDRSPKDEVISTKKVSVEDSGNETETRPASLASSMSLPQVVGIESQSVTKDDLSVEKKPAVGVFSSFQADHSFNGVDAFFGSDELAHRQSLDTCRHSSVNAPTHQINVKENTSGDDENSSCMVSSFKMIDKNETTVSVTSLSATPELGMSQGIDIRKNEILAHKRRAVALKREGKLAEAKEELRQAKLLEKSMEGSHQAVEGSRTAPASTSASDRPPVILERKTRQTQKPVSSRDRFKLQQESLAHKRNALKLRREGKLEESDAEFELAKVLESQLEEISNEGSSSKLGASDDVFVEDLLDPQLISSLKSIGWGDADLVTQPSTKSESSVTVNKDGKSSPEKSQLEEQIKNEKIRAINFKRAGKQAEALEALRAAKRLEKRLESLS